MIEVFKITKKESFIGKHEETSSTCKEAQNQGVDENPRELKKYNSEFKRDIFARLESLG